MPKSIQSLRRAALLAKASSPYDDRAPVVTKASSADAAPANASSAPLAAMSRGQRKRNERKLHKVGKWQSATLLEYSSKKEARAIKEEKEQNLMSDLEKTLVKKTPGVRVKPASASNSSNKMKREIAVREAERMKAVQEHPAFVANPFGAMHAHLEQMIAIRESSTSSFAGVARKSTAVAPVVAAPITEFKQLSASHLKRMRRKAASRMDTD